MSRGGGKFGRSNRAAALFSRDQPSTIEPPVSTIQATACNALRVPEYPWRVGRSRVLTPSVSSDLCQFGFVFDESLDLDTLVLDADLLEAALGDRDPKRKARGTNVKLTGRLRKHAGNPKYKALLADRLEDLKKRHEKGLLLSIDFLKELFELAKDVVKTGRETPVEENIDRWKAALTELFEEAPNGETPVMVRRIVDDIDEVVRAVRFDGWQATHAGEREVKKALRRTLFKYKLHQDADLFERAYGYIREYY